jgi:hypothetical protein
MNILILKNTVADGRIVAAGQAVDVSDADARVLIRMGKAIATVAVETAPAELAASPDDKRKGRTRGNK